MLVAKGMSGRGTSMRKLAGPLGVTEGALRYRLQKLEAESTRDGRSDQPRRWTATRMWSSQSRWRRRTTG